MTAVLVRRVVLTVCAFLAVLTVVSLVTWPLLGDSWLGFVARVVAGWFTWPLVVRVWDWSKVE